MLLKIIPSYMKRFIAWIDLFNRTEIHIRTQSVIKQGHGRTATLEIIQVCKTVLFSLLVLSMLLFSYEDF
jgi:hypothetical protein